MGDFYYNQKKKTLTNFGAQCLYTFRNLNRLGEFRVDISSLPVTKKIAPGEPTTNLIIAFSSLVAASLLHNLVLRYGMAYVPMKYVFDVPVTRILYWLTFVIAIALGFSAYKLYRYRVVTFEPLDVIVAEPYGDTWRSGYRHFEGVRENKAIFQLRAGKRYVDVPFTFVELAHKDKDKSILLYACATEMIAAAPTDAYAKAFRLPVLGAEATFETL